MNIHTFFQASVDALQKYILIHYDKECWVENWVGLSDVRKYFETHGSNIRNPYFTFDWRSAAYRKMAEAQSVFRSDAEPRKEYKPGDTVPMGLLSVDEAHAYFMKNNYALTDDFLLDALKTDGWQAFCNGTHPKTDPIKDEALGCLTAIAADDNMEDQLTHLMWSLKIQHANGTIAADYGTLGFLDIDFVRTNGIGAMFGHEDVEKFLRGEYPPIEIDLRRMQLSCR